MKKNNLLKSSLIIMTSLSLGLVSCKKDKDVVPEPKAPNENEVITTFSLVMIEDGGAKAAPLVFTWKDMDGDGPGKPSKFDTIRLKPNTTYTTFLLLLDETKTPADTISDEVVKEDDEHQFFFKPMAGLGLSVSYLDEDKNKVPVGLETKFTTTTAGNGNLQILLKHQPDVKPKSGSGDETKGSTDIDLTFRVEIKSPIMIAKPVVLASK